jgi:hypothetical protein
LSAGQVTTHAEASHSGVAAGQAMPQPPQCAPSAAVFAQPVAHGVKPAWHVQLPLQIWPGPHATPQPPQLATSLAVLTQLCPHAISGGGQLHVELAQVWVPPQTVPQAPQLLGSVVGLTHIGPQGAVPTAHSPEPVPAAPALPAAAELPPTPAELPPLLLALGRSFAGGEQLVPTAPASERQAPATSRRIRCLRFMLFGLPLWN